MTAFITNNAAVEVSVGVMGFDSKWIEQDHNKVIQGSRRETSAKFKIDLFSINLGMTYYFNCYEEKYTFENDRLLPYGSDNVRLLLVEQLYRK